MKLYLEKIHLDLKVNWKLSRNQTNFKENFIVHLETDRGHFLSEIAPNIRYGETPESIQAQFNLWLTATPIEHLNRIESLECELNKMDLFHSLRFGIESAFLSFIASLRGQKLSQILEVDPITNAMTSFSMPIIPAHEIKDYLAPLNRFDSLKIKVNAETGDEMLKEIRKHTSQKLRIDANEGWSDLDTFVKFQESLNGMNIELIEQPFPSHMKDEYKALKRLTPYKLLADESIEDIADFHELAQQFHAVNIKLMKTGSLIKARNLIREAKFNKMKVMIGCMIETTIGISYGMLFSGMAEYVDLDGFLLVKDEPYGLVSELEGVLSLTDKEAVKWI